MRIKNIENILDDLYEIEGIKACILYRIDGVPITVRIPKDSHFLGIMFWLERQIKHVLKDMNKDGLKATTFDFSDHQIIITPASRSTILVTVVDRMAHQQLISIEIARAKSLINEFVS